MVKNKTLKKKRGGSKTQSMKIEVKKNQIPNEAITEFINNYKDCDIYLVAIKND